MKVSNSICNADCEKIVDRTEPLLNKGESLPIENNSVK